MDKAAQYLGIMRKAGKLEIGETDAGAAVKLPGIDERLAAFADKMFST